MRKWFHGQLVSEDKQIFILQGFSEHLNHWYTEMQGGGGEYDWLALSNLIWPNKIIWSLFAKTFIWKIFILWHYNIFVFHRPAFGKTLSCCEYGKLRLASTNLSLQQITSSTSMVYTTEKGIFISVIITIVNIHSVIILQISISSVTCQALCQELGKQVGRSQTGYTPMELRVQWKDNVKTQPWWVQLAETMGRHALAHKALHISSLYPVSCWAIYSSEW